MRIVGPQAPHRNIIDIAVAGDGSLYVLFRDQILVYGPAADGEVPPVRTIAGKRTGIGNPTGLAVDRRGRLYLSNDGGRDANGVSVGSIFIFAPDADGDAAPIDTIAGTATRLSRPNGVAVASDGSVYVANGSTSVDDLGSIAVFANAARWNAPPLRTIFGTSAFFVSPRGLALDPADTLYVIGGESRFVGRQRISVYRREPPAPPPRYGSWKEERPGWRARRRWRSTGKDGCTSRISGRRPRTTSTGRIAGPCGCIAKALLETRARSGRSWGRTPS